MESLEAKLPQNPHLKTHKLFIVLQICLRILTVATTVIATWLTITNKQSIHFGTIEMDARYSYSPAFKYFAFTNIIGAIFSALSLLVLFFIGRYGSNPTHYFILFLHDLLILSLVLSGCSAATTIGLLGKYGNEHAGWMAICDQFDRFCQRGTISIVFSYLALISLLTLTIISASKSRQVEH